MSMHQNPATAEIIEYLKHEILHENLAEHEKISERALSERFSVSRTIVREALQSLKKDGWLYSQSKSGTYVAELDSAAILENYKARLTLEGEILILAYENITPEDIITMKRNCDDMLSAQTSAEYAAIENQQHRLICQRTNNRYIIHFINTMMEDMLRIGTKAGRTEKRRAACVNEWRSIIRCLEEKDPIGASREFTRHIQNSKEAYETFYHRLGEAGSR